MLGVDPSQRHTGWCLVDAAGATVMRGEIKTETGVPLLDSVRHIRQEFSEVVKGARCASTVVVVMERMHVREGHLFVVMMNLLEILDQEEGPAGRVHMPFPGQLRSFIVKMGGTITNKSSIVDSYKRLVGESATKRTSSHIAESYYLARMGWAILRREYTLNKPAKELKLTEWVGK